MYAAQVLVQVLQTREGFVAEPLTGGMRAGEGLLRTTVLMVYLALMTEQAPGVCETGQLLAASFLAPVRSLMLVHVFAGTEDRG